MLGMGVLEPHQQGIILSSHQGGTINYLIDLC